MREWQLQARRPDGFQKPTRRLRSTVAHISGLALLVVAPGLMVCAGVEAFGRGDDTIPLLICAGLFGGLGALMWSGTRLGDLAPRTVFAAVAWSWLLVSVMGALPYVLARTFAQPGQGRWIELADAVFESVSGYTCTGSTVLTTLGDLGDPDPEVGDGVLFYRQLTQWYGGMGFVQLVITVLPTLGGRAIGFIGAEATGPNTERLSPRATDTARILWKLYVGATVVITLGYVVAGMRPYDALAHALTTSATGGFSMYNDSLGEFDSLPIELWAMAAMAFGGSNWALHWVFLTRDRSVYGRDHEFRAYIGVLIVASTALTFMLWADGGYGTGSTALRAATFNAISLGSSTGFGNAQGPGTAGDIAAWAASPLLVILLLMFVGGMSGSTAGGSKVIRSRILLAISHRTLAEVRQPRAIVPVKLGRDIVSETVVGRVATFMMAYLALIVGGLLVVTLLGGEIEASLAGVVGSLGNMGPAFGEAGPTSTFQAAFPTPARLVLAFLMLAGRLELFAVLLMFAAPRRSVRALRPHKHTF